MHLTAREYTSMNSRRAKLYVLTALDRKQLTVETIKWDNLAGAILQISEHSEAGSDMKSRKRRQAHQ